MKEVKVQDAIGLRLGHDLTRIVPGEFKGRAFKKGHIITEQDIPLLLDIGKEHIYVLDVPEGWVHEEDAAIRMANAAVKGGANLELTEPSEGRVNIRSTVHGLAKVHAPFVNEVNAIEHVVFSTIVSNKAVKPGDTIAATRVVPLIVEENIMTEFEQTAERHRSTHTATLLEVKPFRSLKTGIITTGSEVYTGRIEDKFGPVLREKLAAFGSEVIGQRLSPDDTDSIIEHIRHFQDQKAELILVTGGMSVDPDDKTPGAIKKSGAQLVSYGTPMLPGSMMLLGYFDNGTAIMGLPGAVIYEPFTTFDVLLPRICADDRVERADIVALGYGGLLK